MIAVAHVFGPCSSCGAMPELTAEECTVGYLDGRPQCRKAKCPSCGATWWVPGQRMRTVDEPEAGL